MHKKIVVAAMLLFGATALGQGVSRIPGPPPETALWVASSIGLTSGTNTAGYVLPARGFRISSVVFSVSTASGGGAGANSVITITDGTNTCTVTLPCATSASQGSYRVTPADGAGTGCAYAPGAVLTSSVTTAGCTTTQPTIRHATYLGRWY